MGFSRKKHIVRGWGRQKELYDAKVIGRCPSVESPHLEDTSMFTASFTLA